VITNLAVGTVDTNHSPRWANLFGGDERIQTSSRTEIENNLAFLQFGQGNRVAAPMADQPLGQTSQFVFRVAQRLGILDGIEGIAHGITSAAYGTISNSLAGNLQGHLSASERPRSRWHPPRSSSATISSTYHANRHSTAYPGPLIE
jgi:hypothetical protein